MKVAYTVGRFQPPTIGHKMLIESTINAAGEGGKAYVFVSSALGKGKDAARSPLTSAQKLPLLRNMFPSRVTFVDTAVCDPRCGGPGAALGWLLEQGYPAKDITLVVGAERLADPKSREYFGPTAPLWGDETKPRPGKFVSVGHKPVRDMRASASDADNMSGTKARGYVQSNQLDNFYKAIGIPNYNEIKRDNPQLQGAVESVIATIRASQKGGGEGEEESIPTSGPDGEPPLGGRRTRRLTRNKASGRALSRRGLRSRSGSSRTNRSSCGSRGCSKGSSTW